LLQRFFGQTSRQQLINEAAEFFGFVGLFLQRVKERDAAAFGGGLRGVTKIEDSSNCATDTSLEIVKRGVCLVPFVFGIVQRGRHAVS